MRDVYKIGRTLGTGGMLCIVVPATCLSAYESVPGGVPCVTNPFSEMRLRETSILCVSCTQRSSVVHVTFNAGFAVVKLGVDKVSGEEFAIKIMALPEVGRQISDNENTREDIFKEIDILVGMEHENVIFMKEYFEENNKVRVYHSSSLTESFSWFLQPAIFKVKRTKSATSFRYTW